MTPRESEIIQLIRKEVKPALGCTEPIAVALAVAKAVEIIGEKCPYCHPECPCWRMKADFEILVEVSGNILKNGMGVGIPGTGMVGLHIAAALGAVCGKSKYGLEVLHDLDEDAILRAKELVNNKKIKIGIADTDHKLYVKATIGLGEEKKFNTSAGAIIQDSHDNIVETSFDHIVLSTATEGCSSGNDREISDYHLTVREIYEFVKTIDIKEIEFILDERKLNMALAEEGLNGNYGLCVGKTISENKEEIFGDDFMSYSMALTAAASDARMAGCTLPAMSNSGSGNQGITVSLPVIAYANRYGVDDEMLSRALILSNLIAIHIKGYLGRLSALCGCVIASTGAAAGIVYMKGGNYDNVCFAIKNMIGNITGMVCDGAKVGCAMKVASGVSCAIQSSILALKGTCICETDGIIEKDIEKTIRNLGRLGSVGMQSADSMILDIMVCK